MRDGVTYCAAMVQTEGNAMFLGELWGPEAIVKASDMGCIISGQKLYLARFYPPCARKFSILFRTQEEAEFFMRLYPHRSRLFTTPVGPVKPPF